MESNRSRQAECVICEQTIERDFAFLKDPLCLASSVVLKKPERIMALSLIMVLCLLAYRLAEHRLTLTAAPPRPRPTPPAALR